MPSSGILHRIALVKFLQEPHGVTSQKTAFFLVTAVKTLNLTKRMFGLCFCWFDDFSLAQLVTVFKWVVGFLNGSTLSGVLTYRPTQNQRKFDKSAEP
jgi:hypothetical protein